MSTPLILPSFVSGEASPSLFGHVDLARMKSSAATMRNLFVRYTGGAYSRAGTAFVGYSKQTGRQYPPRLVNFQFSINQGLALEFGNYYMRVIFNGGLVTEPGLAINGASNANPCVLAIASTGALSATPNNGAVNASYAPGDLITLAGGAYSIPAQLQVSSTKLLSAGIATPGSSGVYAPGDTIALAGGVQSTPAQVTVVSTKVISAVIAVAGTGGVAGDAIVTGTTGTGTKFQASVTIGVSGAISTVNNVTLAGSYTVNPTTPAAEPVTGGGLTGAQLNLQIGVGAISITNAGVFTTNPLSAALTQAATSGAGFGFVAAPVLFGVVALSLVAPGSYTAFPANPVAQASTTGSGAGATFTVSSGAVAALAAGDWIYLSSVGGMTDLNGRTVVVGTPSGGNYPLYDVFSKPLDATHFGVFSGGGSASRIYTLATPWAESDLPYLKLTQSADVVSICCVNSVTGKEYPPYDLARYSDRSWTLTQVAPVENMSPPAPGGASGSTFPPSSTGWAGAYYQYVVTAVNSHDGTESIASSPISLANALDIAATAGSNTINWGAVAGANQYNVYKCTPAYNFISVSQWRRALTPPPVGSLFGFVGAAYGTSFVDGNLVADFAQTPPTHKNPFARGQVIDAQPTSVGANYTYATATINSATGSGARIAPVITYGSNGGYFLVPGPISGYIVQDAGQGYLPGDTVTITGDGSGAACALTIGPQSGTYPGVVSYFQERRVYANTLNQPDTYWMSQPGAFTNFDSRIPVIATDAFTGTPWSQQVNGVQFCVPMPGGLVVLTGLSAWQLTGAGGSSINPQPISASNQQAQPQAYNGCSPTVPPIKIEHDIIYMQAKGSIYRDLAYQFFTNIYTGTDLTQNSLHLFLGYTIREHAWCEEPYKVLWSVRNDGALLSMTYLKAQEIVGWARHDTQGQFVSVCSVTEPPIDALYLAVQRSINGNVSYMLERMDDRLWTSGVESTWCVDAGLALYQPQPAATLSASTPYGAGALSGITNIVGGQGYSAATTASVVDNNGQGHGSGATVALTIINGFITNAVLTQAGAGYTSPQLVVSDPQNTGSGFSAAITLDNSATFTATAPVFSSTDIGAVIRAGGGMAVITAFANPSSVTANIITPMDVLPNSINITNPSGLAASFPAGAWTKTAPVTQISGLYHLAGATITGIADGNVLPQQVVPDNGVIVLAAPASSVKIGLSFQCQLQTVNLDAGEPTAQGQRKKVAAATVRVESSRGLLIGSNQPNGSMTSPIQIAPQWSNLDTLPDLGIPAYNGNVIPLFTGDVRAAISGGFQTAGQVAIQQNNPLPMQILAIIPEDYAGDRPEQQAQQRPQKGQKG